jgi:hypothetical protein
MTHGTNVAYTTHGCHCNECRRANREYERARTRRAIQGRSLFVPAEPVRARVLALRLHGMSDDEIARAAGLNDARLSDLMCGHWRTGRPLTRMKRENADAIMAVTHRAPALGTYIAVRDFPGMTLDLMALGYSAAWIARHLRMSYQGRASLLRTRVKASTYVAMVKLHGATAFPAPESAEATRSRNFAVATRGHGPGKRSRRAAA